MEFRRGKNGIWVRNVGCSNGAELATYVVERGKPLITLVK
jgi:hypothetical protein